MVLSLSSTGAATTLAGRRLYSALVRSCAPPLAGFPSGASRSLAAPPPAPLGRLSVAADASLCRAWTLRVAARPLSAMPPPPTAHPPGAADGAGFPPPKSLALEAGLAAQGAMKLFVEHGLGKRKLDQIAADREKAPLVDRWQRMVATYLETQCHIIALLGYKPDETGIALYTQHVTQALGMSSPEAQEQLRVAGRDTYRMVLAAAFDMPSLIEEQKTKGELSVVDARNIMHKVSLRMQDPEVLEKVAKLCSTSVAMNDSPEAKQIDLARKHTVVQKVMVDDVYLCESDNGVSLVQECGFGQGEEGYVRMQGAMAEHQADPLISQYVGASMMKLLQSAGIDMGALQQGQVS